MNRVQLIGCLGGDPEIRKFKEGLIRATFMLATNDGYYRNDEWINKTNWHRIVCWGNQARRAEDKLKTGTKVLIEGELAHSSYQENGETRYRTEVDVSGPRSTIEALKDYIGEDD